MVLSPGCVDGGSDELLDPSSLHMQLEIPQPLRAKISYQRGEGEVGRPGNGKTAGP